LGDRPRWFTRRSTLLPLGFGAPLLSVH
jgi:hypothetical protein